MPVAIAQALSARARFRIALWWQARLLPMQLYRRPLNAVLAQAHAEPVAQYRDLPVDYIVRRVRRTVRHPWLMRDRRCLREGLLAYRFMLAAGHAPELHFGIDRAAFPAQLKAHCWVVHHGKTVMNADWKMVPIYVHRAGDGPAAIGERLAGATFA